MKYPIALTILGNLFNTIGFLFLGPATFINIELSIPLIYVRLQIFYVSDDTYLFFFKGMYSIISIGNALYSVSTYGRAHNAAMRLGFNDDIDTYLLISSKYFLND